MAKLSEKALRKRDAARDIGAELLASVQDNEAEPDLDAHNWRRMSRTVSVAGRPRFLSTAYAFRRRSSSVF